MRVDLIIVRLLLLMRFIVGYETHVSDDWTFFGAGCEHD
jgi:hypothetical protein